MPSDDFRSAYLRDIARTYRNYKALGERAMAQVSDADLHTLINPDPNSIAIIGKRLAAKLRARFSDVLAAAGENPARNREAEFQMADQAPRAEMMQWWESKLKVTLGASDALPPEDL